ncbi:MAG: response regulator [Patescibacteria group bacterium]|jgi:CheY-like chemotaxis protein
MEKPTVKHILVVDDDSMTRRLFGSLLARAGFEVLYAKDGNDGREMARRLHPDLILLDLNMPVMDGMETADRLKSDADPVVASIPIILLTSEDLSIEAQKAVKELGVLDYLQKGVTNEEFIERVQKIIGAPQKPAIVK